MNSFPTIEMDGDSVVLCCGRRKCPRVRVQGSMVKISDDDGNEIRIRVDQALLIPDAIKRLNR